MTEVREMGATVYVHQPSDNLIHLLRLLESEPEVFIVSQVIGPSMGYTTLALRSDQFPSAWDGKTIRVLENDGRVGDWLPVDGTVGIQCTPKAKRRLV